MKRIIKGFLKVLLICLSVLLILIAFISLYIAIGSKKAQALDDYEGTSLSSWMNNVNDTTLVKDIVLPGSHDAGTESMFYAGRTQKYGIKDQLNRGVRYFDIRVNKNKGELVIFHSVLNGDDYRSVLVDINDFLYSNPSEGLILDFQHFKNDAMNDSLNLLQDLLGEDKLIYNYEDNTSDIEFISNLDMGALRGKCLITVGANINKE